MNAQDIIQEIQQKQLCWYGHVQRMKEERIPRKVMDWTPSDRRRCGRLKCTWEQRIQKAMSERNLHPGNWNDKRGWRLGIGGRRRTL